MDPQATWDRLLEAISNQDWDQVEELAMSLMQWLDRGGFPPRAVLGTDVGTEWDRAVTRFTCAFALAIANKHNLATNDEGELMKVDLKDGCCRSCGGQLTIVDVDDATMAVECIDSACADNYTVEHDAFGDGAMHYALHYLADQTEVNDDE